MSFIIVPLGFVLASCSDALLRNNEVYNTTAVGHTNPHDPVSGVCDSGVKQLFGYMDGGGDAKLFHWFFESRTDPKTAPTLVFFQGGPGGSSMLSVVSGNGGPCKVNEDDLTAPVRYSWNAFSNVMYIDQPAPTGFSKGTPPTNSIEAAKSTVKALEAFFGAHPEYNTKVFLTGQSFAGHYVPAILSEIMNRTSAINVEGIALGNPSIAPGFHYGSDPDMAFKSGTAPSVITQTTYNEMKAGLKKCLFLVSACNRNPPGHTCCLEAYGTCRNLTVGPIEEVGRDINDLRRVCHPSECNDYSSLREAEYPIPEFSLVSLRNISTLLLYKTTLVCRPSGLSQIWRLVFSRPGEWMPDPFTCVLSDMARKYDSLLIPALNAGKRVFVFAGDQDYLCNWIGNRAWLLNLKWDGLAGYKRAKTMLFKLPDGNKVGKLKTFTLTPGGGQLSFLQVFAAGHSATRDSPAGVQKAMVDFVNNKLR